MHLKPAGHDCTDMVADGLSGFIIYISHRTPIVDENAIGAPTQPNDMWVVCMRGLENAVNKNKQLAAKSCARLIVSVCLL